MQEKKEFCNVEKFTVVSDIRPGLHAGGRPGCAGVGGAAARLYSPQGRTGSGIRTPLNLTLSHLISGYPGELEGTRLLLHFFAGIAVHCFSLLEEMVKFDSPQN